MERARRGFTARERAPDWSIDGDFLCWKSPATHKIRVADLRHFVFSNDIGTDGSHSEHPAIPLPNNHPYKTPQGLRAIERYKWLDRAVAYTAKDFFKVAPFVLKSRHWTDAEKLHLLSIKLNQFSGFRYGKELQSLLAQCLWTQRSGRDRIMAFYKHCEQDSIVSERAQSDAEEFERFSDPLILFRGFNVPPNETIRNRNVRKSWFQQETGKSVFFTTDEAVARWFACIQKARAVQKYQRGLKLTSEDKSIIGGRLCLAKYEASLADTILYQNRTGMNEKEVIILPFDTRLKSYKFLSFDDFVGTLSRSSPMSK